MPQYRALVTYTAKLSVGLPFEAADKATAATVVQTIAVEAAPFDTHGTRIRHALGAIEMWDADSTGFAIDDIEENADAI